MTEIFTTKGMMDEALLHRVDGGIDDEREHTVWTEYYHEGELVRRDVHVTLKEGLGMPFIQQDIG